MITLRPEQKKAVEQLKNGSILVGGVGSGKSITALVYFVDKVCQGNYTTNSTPLRPRDLYIITTARKRDTLEWHDEFAKFCLATDRNSSLGHILVTVDSWNNIRKYETVTNAFFIFDEQRVVGAGSWVRSYLKIVKNNQWILLSATPGDTWSDYIPVFIANGFYKNRTAFLRQHAIFDRFAKYPKIIKYVDTDRLIRFRKQILVKMNDSRHTKRHVLDVKVGYDKDIYDVAFKNRWNPYEDEPIRDAGQLCYILRKIVNNDFSRIDKIIELLKKHNKAIIFYNLDSELELLRSIPQRYFEVSDYSIAEWNGHKHEMIPKTDKWVYLVQYTAGAEGWNCTETDTVIFYSLNYSYKIMEQASGRIDRINTPYSDLYYYRLVSGSSIDKAILHALKNKKIFNEKAFLRT
jgi:hypothetical protein